MKLSSLMVITSYNKRNLNKFRMKFYPSSKNTVKSLLYFKNTTAQELQADETENRHTHIYTPSLLMWCNFFLHLDFIMNIEMCFILLFNVT